MAQNDTLAAALSAILNAEKKGKYTYLISQSSKVIENVLKIMQKYNYIGSFNVVETSRGKILEVKLSGNINKCGVIKPRFSVSYTDFEKFEKRFLPAKNFGILIISTSKGLMTHAEAEKIKIGGKLIAYCY